MLFPELPHFPGDFRSLNLVENGCFVTPYVNDVFGNTDKLNTHSASLGCTVYPENFWNLTFFSGLTWRLVTPIAKTNRYEKMLDEPIGSYADWVSLQNSALKAFDSLYIQVSGTLHHIGPKGGKQFQNETHRFFKNENRFSWQPQTRYVGIGFGSEAGYNFNIKKLDSIFFSESSLRLGIGCEHSGVFSECYFSSRISSLKVTNQSFTENFGPASFYVHIGRITNSRLFPVESGISGFRKELGLSLKWFRYFITFVSYSHPFVEGDKHPQIFVSPLGFSYDLQ